VRRPASSAIFCAGVKLLAIILRPAARDSSDVVSLLAVTHGPLHPLSANTQNGFHSRL